MGAWSNQVMNLIVEDYAINKAFMSNEKKISILEWVFLGEE